MNRRTASALVLLAALGAGACSDSSGPTVGPPAVIVAVMGNEQSGQAGAPLGTPVTVRVNDSQGQGVAGVVVTFAVQDGGGSVSAGQAQTDAQGQAQTVWTLGTQAGAEQRMVASFPRASGGTAVVLFRATATAGPPVALVKAGGDNQHGGTAAPLTDSLAVRVTDQFGNGVQGITVTFTAAAGSVSPTTRTTDAQGFARTRWVLGPSQGVWQAQASAGSLPGVTFTATAQPLAAITSVTPALLVPGGTMVISGINFPADPAAIALTVAGTAVTVTAATATEIRATLPTAGFGCVPTGAALVQLTAAGSTTTRAHPVQLVQQRGFAVGQGLVSSTTDRLDCLDLPQGGSRYVIALTNTNATVAGASTLGFRLSTVAAAQVQAAPSTETGPSAAWVAPAAVPPFTVAERQALLRAAQRRAAHERHHEQILRANAELVDATRGAALPRRAAAASTAGTAAIPEMGALLPMRVPRVDAGTASCNSFDEIQARVAYVGQRAIVLEDTANPVKGGALDAYYRQIGEEFDSRQYNIIRDNFGDPLALDAQLNNDGRLYMLFTRRVDGNRIAGFVFSGDFRSRTGPQACAQSNEAEIFYGYAPQNLSTNFQDEGSLQWWRWEIRSVVIHEVKHIASFASRIQQNVISEESWLEEASAMVAEEIWARQVFGYGRDNVGYAASIGCELRGLFERAPCEGRPGAMFSHFMQLADWMRTPDARSPLGAAMTNDGSFYGSGWALLRHLVDHSGRPEAEILRELNQSTTRGAANVQARTGRSFNDVIGDWALAMALDDRTGVASTGRWHVPGWNLRDVYAGLNFEQPGVMPTRWPLAETPLSFVNATQNVSGLRGGSTTYFELAGTSVPLALHILGEDGGPLSSALRIQVFRIQ
jgi:hypothetical protein